MLDQKAIESASAILWDHWQRGQRLLALPPACRPTTREEGYAVQALVEARSASPLFGWKIAATSDAGQAHIGVDGPLAGRLLRERALDSGALVSIASNHMRVAEPEFAFRMGHDVAPRPASYSMPEVLDAVVTLHPAIEIPDSRYEDFAKVGAAQLIADLACAHCFVLGPATQTPWRELDLAQHRVEATVADRYRRQGQGANVLGDPRVALSWLANELSRLGITLKAGQVVTTGTCMKPLEIEPGDVVRADFGAIGQVQVRFGD